jgi:hypothetical protein
MSTNAPVKPNPPFWFRLSVTAGNLIQLAGLLVGAGLIYAAAHMQGADIVRILLMVLGWIVIYICCHAIAHWLVGRLVGIRFKGYGVRGTDHPENYGPGMREVMSITPFFTVMTEKESMKKASPTAKALMFAAGETSSNLAPLVASFYAWQRGIPGGGILFIVTIIWDISGSISTAIFPKGDYAKALRALREKPSSAASRE